ncbi:alpha/beta hydrolase [Neoroseomonas oryzicola]|uniref:Alpha/beta hydrolase n=1 Tax=Neoroseomonas oryzicola TaxID=535904 RepID=A0A9X9WCD9_9PROT|nr:alpha/beta hydrolase [Neoroseomonas oryzicola]MBR0657999.1 alpha/beta hydrolase [Neoroseomonas oryzicola]NKE20064.1 alpha/beta hydrolase [Neoroseomonas oryzicola]
MLNKTRKLLVRIAAVGFVLLVVVLALRVWDMQNGPPLGPWHTFVPEELDRDAVDRADWARWIAAEDSLFASVRREVSGRLEPEEQVATNRYFSGSPVDPDRFARNWNRSFVLEPDGPPRGAAVFLHGLTDAPFSLRHFAETYRARGFVAIGIRMPGHGAAPSGLTQAVWEDWMAATRLAVREARRRAGTGLPLHIVGYSNGGALALKHALDALEDERLPQADRLVLISPMVGVTAFARFAGIAGLPALLPRFAKTAWLDIQPEFNPFKFNSFPVNAARQTYRLTAALHEQLDRLATVGTLRRLPPVLTFQSVVDATVSTPAVLSRLYARLPANGSEIVLFDLNRNTRFGPLFGAGADAALERILPPAPRDFAVTVIANISPATTEATVRRTPAGATATEETPLGLAWPRDVFSLSHVALPFPPQDGLYGNEPDPADDFGVRLGALAVRGERGVLAVGLDSLSRVTWNPFFPYVLDRVTGGLPPP